jgi:hypothetical protein
MRGMVREKGVAEIMAAPKRTATAAPHPRWDGRRVLFEVIDEGRSVACAISMNALQDLSGRRRFKPADLLECFAAARPRIEAIALGKLRARPEGGVSGIVHIWSDDIDDLTPPASAPAGALRTA